MTNLNDEIVCRTPSSRISKSSAVSDDAGLPLRSTTVASTRTMFVPVRKTGGACGSCATARSDAISHKAEAATARPFD